MQNAKLGGSWVIVHVMPAPKTCTVSSVFTITDERVVWLLHTPEQAVTVLSSGFGARLELTTCSLSLIDPGSELRRGDPGPGPPFVCGLSDKLMSAVP